MSALAQKLFARLLDDSAILGGDLGSLGVAAARFVGGAHPQLGSLRCRAEDLNAVAERLRASVPEDGHPPTPIPISITGRSSVDSEWDSDRVSDAADLNRFLAQTEEIAEIAAYEVPAPDANPEERLHDLHGFSTVELYLVLPGGAKGEDWVAAIAEEEWIGASLDLDLLASVDSRADAVHAVTSLDVPFRVRGGTTGQGIALLAAAALSISADLSKREIATVLDRPELLLWGADSVRWNEWTATAEAVEHIRDLCGGIDVGDVDAFLEKLSNWDGVGILGG